MIQITNKTNCCGCTACVSICPEHCITMVADNEGFLYPSTDASLCINCGLCEKACPIINVKDETQHGQTAYLIQHRDEKILTQSTSGGAFTALAQKVIQTGGVVYGAVLNSKLQVEHIGVEREEYLYKFRNSKYVQSRLNSTFAEAKQYLQNNRSVLFSGTPCQIEGLKKYLGKEYEKLFTVDVVCHAVPSPLIWEKYLDYRQKEFDGKIVKASFRNKEKYGYEYSQLQLEDNKGNKKHWGVETDPFMRAFFGNLIDRPSCYDCKFKKRYRVSDITIWDCFDVYKLDKSFDDNRGVTRVLAHTEKGKRLVESLGEFVHLQKIDTEQAVDGVREMVNSVPYSNKRNEFFSDANRLSNDELFAKWFPYTLKVKAEGFARKACEKLGVYRVAKRTLKKILRK